jgi:hypothetical protein
MNVPSFPPACLTPSHTTSTVRATYNRDLDTAIRARVGTLGSIDPTLIVLGVIRLGPREAVIVSQRPLGAHENVCISATVRDKGAR